MQAHILTKQQETHRSNVTPECPINDSHYPSDLACQDKPVRLHLSVRPTTASLFPDHLPLQPSSVVSTASKCEII
jgi:hypothetical protein